MSLINNQIIVKNIEEKSAIKMREIIGIKLLICPILKVRKIDKNEKNYVTII
jgi:hypothetical protein